MSIRNGRCLFATRRVLGISDRSCSLLPPRQVLASTTTLLSWFCHHIRCLNPARMEERVVASHQDDLMCDRAPVANI